MKYNFRNVLAYLTSKILIYSGKVKSAKERALKEEIILPLYFHNPSKMEFEFMINWYKKNGFKFISINDLKDIISEKKVFPRGAVLLTVDDGWASNVQNIAEVAKKEKVPVSIFVATEAIENGNYCFSIAKWRIGSQSFSRYRSWKSNQKLYR